MGKGGARGGTETLHCFCNIVVNLKLFQNKKLRERERREIICDDEGHQMAFLMALPLVHCQEA